jgi:hypothetical protein
MSKAKPSVRTRTPKVPPPFNPLRLERERLRRVLLVGRMLDHLATLPDGGPLDDTRTWRHAIENDGVAASVSLWCELFDNGYIDVNARFLLDPLEDEVAKIALARGWDPAPLAVDGQGAEPECRLLETARTIGDANGQIAAARDDERRVRSSIEGVCPPPRDEASLPLEVIRELYDDLVQQFPDSWEALPTCLHAAAFEAGVAAARRAWAAPSATPIPTRAAWLAEGIAFTGATPCEDGYRFLDEGDLVEDETWYVVRPSTLEALGEAIEGRPAEVPGFWRATLAELRERAENSGVPTESEVLRLDRLAGEPDLVPDYRAPEIEYLDPAAAYALTMRHRPAFEARLAQLEAQLGP